MFLVVLGLLGLIESMFIQTLIDTLGMQNGLIVYLLS
jgi:hypothetical protein